MKKRVVCLLLALAAAVPLGAVPAEGQETPASAQWSSAYRNFVIGGEYRRSGQTWYQTAPAFALHDLDGDGMPELLARNNAPDRAEQTAYVYTVGDDGVSYAGSAGVRGPAERFAPGSGYPGLSAYDGEKGTYYSIKNGQVTAQALTDPGIAEAFGPKGADLTFCSGQEILEMGWDAFEAMELRADNSLFSDVSLAHWGWSSVRWACVQGLMTGTGGGAFTPSGTVSRAQAVTILYRMDGSPGVSGRGFSDVSSGAWYADSSRWAAKIGLTDAGQSRFRPNEALERQDLARLLYLYTRYKGISATAAVAVFSDWNQVREDCVEAMYWAVGAGLINGTGDGRLDPSGSVTRAQLSAVLQRYSENVLKN